MDFTPLIICGSISLLIISVSLFFMSIGYYYSRKFDLINNGKLILFDGGVYEKKD